MTKNKLIAVGVTVILSIITAAVQSGVVPNVCPCPSATPSPQLLFAPASPAAPAVTPALAQ